MLRKFMLLLAVTLLFWLTVQLVQRQRESAPAPVAVPAPQFELEPIVPPAEARPNRVADINVHSVEELETLFGRIEALLQRPLGEGEPPLITVVLHGPEVEFFALGNYESYKPLVDRAAKLAAFGAVDMAICRTQMKMRGIATDQVPNFLRQVPYGPDEVTRLSREGYVSM